MIANVVSTGEGPNKYNYRLAPGAVHQDLIQAVEIISTDFEVPGSMAYQILVQASHDLLVSMRDLARSVVEAPESLDYFRVAQKRAQQALADDAGGKAPA